MFHSEEEALQAILDDRNQGRRRARYPLRRSQRGAGNARNAEPNGRHHGQRSRQRCRPDHRRHDFSGGSHGFVVGHVTPEAAVGGPIALVEDGDRLRIDAESKEISVDVSDEELAATAQGLDAAGFSGNARCARQIPQRRFLSIRRGGNDSAGLG